MKGELLKNTYRVISELGHGGMGTVYLAEHRTLPRKFAVKVLSLPGTPSPELLARFEREATIASGLGHPNIVEVLDFDWQADGSPYIVMELLHGEDLAQRLRRQGSFTTAALLPICRQICAGLAAAHGAEIVHRDLKPQNIFLHQWGADEIVKIVDFGISKIRGGETQLTADYALVGTPHYMAPEQAKGGAAQVDGRADLFSLGAILYECLTGKVAFPGATLPEVIHGICYGDRPRLATSPPCAPGRLDAVLVRLMAKERDDRYPDVHAAWAELAPALGGEAGPLVRTEARTPAGDSGAIALEATMDSRDRPVSGLEATQGPTPTPEPSRAQAPSPPSAPASDALSGPTPAPAAAVAPAPSAAIPMSQSPVPSPAPRPRWALWGTILVVLAGLVWIAFWVQRSRGPGKPMPDSGVPRPSQASPDSKDDRLRIALLPPECPLASTELLTSLRESALSTLPGVLVPDSDVAKALRAAKPGEAPGDRELGERLGAALIVGSRCAGGRVKVRLVSVAEDAVLATEEVDPKTTREQVQVLVTRLLAERTLLEAKRETRSADAFQHYKSAMLAIQSGLDNVSYEPHITALRKAIGADPRWERPRLVLSSALLNKYEQVYDDALLAEISGLVGAIAHKAGPRQAQALLHLGLAALWREEIASGRKLLVQAASLGSTDPKIQVVLPLILAHAHRLDGDFESALALTTRGARDGFGAPHLNLAGYLMSLGQIEEALQEVDKAVAIQDRQIRLGDRDPDIRRGVPGLVGAHSTRGYVLLMLGRPREALAEHRTELTQMSSRASFYGPMVNMAAQFGLASAHRALGERPFADEAQAKALEALEAMLTRAKNPNFPLFNEVGGILPWLPDVVLDLAGRYIKPGLPFASYAEVFRALSLYQLGKHKEADQYLQKTLAQAKPGRVEALRATYGYTKRTLDILSQLKRKARPPAPR